MFYATLILLYRLQFGCGCTPSRRMSRYYFVKALANRHASSATKAHAHAALIAWYTASAGDFRSRLLHAASHHADHAARLSGPGKAPPAALSFTKNMFEPQSQDARYLPLIYKDAMKAFQRRNAELEQETERMEEKRLKRPNRYRCAAVGCEVSADTGKMLSQCQISQSSILLSVIDSLNRRR